VHEIRLERLLASDVLERIKHAIQERGLLPAGSSEIRL